MTIYFINYFILNDYIISTFTFQILRIDFQVQNTVKLEIFANFFRTSVPLKNFLPLKNFYELMGHNPARGHRSHTERCHVVLCYLAPAHISIEAINNREFF